MSANSCLWVKHKSNHEQLLSKTAYYLELNTNKGSAIHARISKISVPMYLTMIIFIVKTDLFGVYMFNLL